MSVVARFWGTRGSIPTPGAKTVRYGGNTSCMEVRGGGSVIVCDAGTGLRELGVSLLREFGQKPIDIDMFVTHTHWDHIQGFPFFVPAYQQKNRLRIHSAPGVGADFERIFRGQMGHAYFPVEVDDMPSAMSFISGHGPFEASGAKVRTLFTNHPGVDMAYRFDFPTASVVYLTAHECHAAQGDTRDYFTGQDRTVADFCRGADLVVCDSQYNDEDYKLKRGWGHSRWRDSVALGIAAEVKKLALYHHDPTRSDDDVDEVLAQAKAMVGEAGSKLELFAAAEGQEVSLP